MKEFFGKVKAFFKSLWQKILANKVVSIVVAAVLVVGVSTAIIVSSLTGGKPPVDSSDSSVETSQEVETCVVTFETNGGTAVESVKVEKGETIDLDNYVTEKEGSFFWGWALDAEFTTRANTTFTVVADTTLYAEWGADVTYSLIFDTNGGTEIAPVAYRPNAYLVAPENPTKTNYTFGGWYRDENCTDEFDFLAAPQMPKKDLTIYAKWNALNAIEFDTNGGTPIETVYGEVGSLVGEVATPTKAGYIFDGWYTDNNTWANPYEITIIPSGVVKVYAKWHVQRTDITVNLHINYGGMTTVTTLTDCNEGEMPDANAAIKAFSDTINAELAQSFRGEGTLDLTNKPIVKFTQWAYDAKGSNRFDGAIPGEDVVDLYAVWSRTASYCEITFIGSATESSYFVLKDSVVSETLLNEYLAEAEEAYGDLGCTVDGFYTAGGKLYKGNEKVAMDMRLIPNVYSAGLAYEYVRTENAVGTEVEGYKLIGYNSTTATENATKDSLLLLIPTYYSDGTHGELPVLWIGDSAFASFNVSEVTLPTSLLGIGAEAFKSAKLAEIEIPTSVYYIGANAFSGNGSLASVSIKGSISYFGATIFKDTPYETNMPSTSVGTNGLFRFFDTAMTFIYSYEGTDKTVTTPKTSRTIASGAFSNATIETLILNDGIRYVGDYAFEGSTVKTVTIGKSFASMGVGVFKDCKSLESVTFVFKYNLAVIGESMFEGCSNLKSINISQIESLKEISARAFFGCSSLTYVQFTNNFLKLGASAFENCTALETADFGTDDDSKFSSIGNRAFAGCTSLKRIILRGKLLNSYSNSTSIVAFGTEVFDGAGYTKDGAKKQTIIFVKDTYVDNWRDDENVGTLYNYVGIYKKYLPVEYREMPIKGIDSTPPEVWLDEDTVTVNAGAVDVLAAIEYSITEEKDVVDYFVSVAVYMQNGQEIVATNGKHNLVAGTYNGVLTVEDEMGNKTQVEFSLVVA